MTTPQTTTPSLRMDDLITKKEAARRLAVSVRTLDRVIERGALERVYVMGCARVRSRDIQRIVTEGI